MDITLKYKLLEKIIQSNDDAVLREIESLLSLSESDFWGGLPAEVKQGINAAKGELERGEGIPHHQIMAEIKQRFQNSKWQAIPLSGLQRQGLAIIR